MAMNKAQIEVQKALIGREKEIEKALKATYKQALEDTKEKIKLLSADEITQSKIYQIGYQKDLERQLEKTLGKLEKNSGNIEKYLKDVYSDRYIGVRYGLSSYGLDIITPINEKAVVESVMRKTADLNFSQRLYNNLDELKRSVKAEISRGISSGATYNDIARQVAFATDADFKKSMRIARTEGHRIQSEAGLKSMKDAKDQGADLEKEWDATLDNGTRDSHAAANGQTREVEKAFEVGGYQVDGPGLFGVAGEDIHCRCIALEKPKWAAESKQLEQNFEEYKDEYIRNGNAHLSDIKSTERNISKLDKEKAMVFDKDENLLFMVQGTKNSVKFTNEQYDKLKGNIVTHNHPSNGTLSDQDLYLLFDANPAELRVVINKGTYYMELPGAIDKKIDSHEKLKEEWTKQRNEVTIEAKKLAEKGLIKTKKGYTFYIQNKALMLFSRKFGVNYGFKKR